MRTFTGQITHDLPSPDYPPTMDHLGEDLLLLCIGATARSSITTGSNSALWARSWYDLPQPPGSTSKTTGSSSRTGLRPAIHNSIPRWRASGINGVRPRLVTGSPLRGSRSSTRTPSGWQPNESSSSSRAASSGRCAAFSINPAAAQAAHLHLHRIAQAAGPVTTEDAAFGGLAHATGIVGVIYPGFGRRHLRRRFQEIAKGQWTARAVTQAAVSASTDAAIRATTPTQPSRRVSRPPVGRRSRQPPMQPSRPPWPHRATADARAAHGGGGHSHGH